jgi:gamma-glutamyltranspeptidase/glutathione hydrolase
MRDFQLPGRSAVFATRAMAATPNPHATRVAVETLRAGGTAADAAVAAAAVLAVVEPNQTGIGGDAFFILAREGRDELVGWNGSGRSPVALEPAEAARSWGPTSPHTVTVPGAVDTWCTLIERHGRLPLDRVLAPAIALARDGFPVHPRTAFEWQDEAAKLAARPATAARFLPGGRAPRAGDIVRFPGLAQVLERIARNGRAGFYAGEVAADIIATLRRLGSRISEDDLARHRGEAVTPVRSAYRGVEIAQIPPNNQGLTALVLLNLAERFALARHGPVDPARLHLLVEAARLAYRDRDLFIADPAVSPVPVTQLLSKDRARTLATAIAPDRAMRLLPDPGVRHSDTVYLTVVDESLTAVSFINSVYHAFGSGIATERFGFLLQNRGFGFTLEEGHPNALAPAKRPLHTIMPGMAVQDGRLWASYGVMGGDYQPMGHAQVLTLMIDQGLDPQEALEQPRVHHQGGKVLAERGLPTATVQALQALGHDVVAAPDPHGGGQIIRVDHDRGVLIGGSEPRMDGLALGY